MSESSRFVLLVNWSDGRSEQIEIPAAPGRSCALLEVGPRDQEPCATVPVYANDAPTLAEVIVHGAEIPSMLVCPAPPAKPEPCPDCGTPMVDVIPSLSRTRQSLPMCPQCHPVTCHDGTIVEPLGPFSCSGERLSVAPARTVSTALAYPSTCLPDVPGAYDVQVYVAEGDFAATGEVTMVPHLDDRQPGVWVPYGLEPSTWVDGHLLERLRARYGDDLHKVLGQVADSAADCCAEAARQELS